ncbi:MAG: hypothetical protein ACK46A_08340 [Akkermansiaceae bacterium]|jgi:hypothetical protein|nr:hypothetical protein [Luteolibacter sp.]
MHFYDTTAPAMTHDILSYVSLAFLIAIFLLALRINSKLSGGSNKITNHTRPNSAISTSEKSEYHAEASHGTPFEEFLNEDPTRRTMSKKEQFAAYRDWRSSKGLNWK